MPTATAPNRVVPKDRRLQWVPVSAMQVSTHCQRDYRKAHAEKIAANFDPDKLTEPTVSKRGGTYYVIDGQHRVAAFRILGWEDQQLQCWVYEGLTEAEEADFFLTKNDFLNVATFDKFRIGVTAGRAEDVDIDRIVRANGLRISKSKATGVIGAVSALRKVYKRSGGSGLGRVLRIMRDSFGDAPFEGSVIDAVGLVVHRYGDELDDERIIEKLLGVKFGQPSLLRTARKLNAQYGGMMSHSIAAAIVDVLNVGKGGKKLATWYSGA